MSLIIELTQPL